MAKRKQATKAKKIQPFCACGCGAHTRGGTFKMGHDQRLRGLIKRGETLKAVTLAFLKEQKKTSEWAKLRLKGSRGSVRKGSAPTRLRKPKTRVRLEHVKVEAVKSAPVES